MPKVYISYRPEDSSRNEIPIIEDRLIQAFGAENILKSTLNRNESTVELQERVQSCDVLLVVIGRYWLTLVDDQGRPLLEDPYDPVHVEIDASIRSSMVIKVLIVDDTPLPEPKSLPDSLRSLLQKDIYVAENHEFFSHFLVEVITELSEIPLGYGKTLKYSTNHQRRLRTSRPLESPHYVQRELTEQVGYRYQSSSGLRFPIRSRRSRFMVLLLVVGGMVAMFTLYFGLFQAVSRNATTVRPTPNQTGTIKRVSDEDAILLNRSNTILNFAFSDVADEFVFVRQTSNGQPQLCRRKVGNSVTQTCVVSDEFERDIVLHKDISVGVAGDWRHIVVAHDFRWEILSVRQASNIIAEVAIDSENERVVVVTESGYLNYWDYYYTSREVIRVAEESVQRIDLVIDSPLDRLLVNYNDHVVLFQLSSMEILADIEFKHDVRFADFIETINGAQVFVLTNSLTAYQLQIDTLDIQRESKFLSDGYYLLQDFDMLDITRKGILAIPFQRNTIALWDVEAEQIISEVETSDHVRKVQFNATDQYLAIVYDAGMVIHKLADVVS